MANIRKSYFLAPTWDISPGQEIVLGSIITDPRNAEDSLNYQATIPTGELPPHSEIKPFEIVLNRSQKGELGLYAQFLSIVGFGGDLGGESAVDVSYNFHLDSLITQTFHPSRKYIEDSMRIPEVLRFLNEHRFRKDVYMVTGLKTAYGATINTASSKEHGFKTQVGVNLAAAGAPVNVGPKFTTSAKQSAESTSRIASNFVLAYRLKKIRYMKKSRDYKAQDYVEGATLGIDTGSRAATTVPQTYDVLVIDSHDVGADEFDLKSIDGLDEADHGLCECVLLEEREED